MLTKLWRWLFGGCDHRWEYLETRRLFNNEYDKLPIKTWYILGCQHCGNIKKRRV